MRPDPHLLQARGHQVKDHPVIRRLLSLRSLLGDLSELDEKLEPQIGLLLKAIAAGVDHADDGDSDEESDAEGGEEGEEASGDSPADQSGADSGDDEVDEDDLEEEEARFMGVAPGDAKGDVDDRDPSPAALRKRRRAAQKERASAKARAERDAGTRAVDDALEDFGDEDVGEPSKRGKRGAGGGGGAKAGDTLLQGMVNRISQRERSGAKKGSGLQGDLDVPFREKDMTIRVRRPAPGESEDEAVDNALGSDAGGSDLDDLGLGSGGFMGGLPPELLKGLNGSGAKGSGKKEGKSTKRSRGDAEGGGVDEDESEGEEGGEDEDSFYVSVAEGKKRKKRAKDDKYRPKPRIAGALEAELEEEREAKGGGKRGANYAMIKNKGLTPHKNKLNRNPRVKKREAFRKAVIRRKGQVMFLPLHPVSLRIGLGIFLEPFQILGRWRPPEFSGNLEPND